MRFKNLAAFAACSLALAIASGCAAPAASSPEMDAQKANRAYMSSVNETMNDLDAGLDAFVQATSRNDVVGMSTQADKALSALDELEKIEAPEALTDIHKGYIDGTAKLEGALKDYVALYTEAKTENSPVPFGSEAFNERVKGIQSTYDEGIELLKSTDEKAAELQ